MSLQQRKSEVDTEQGTLLMAAKGFSKASGSVGSGVHGRRNIPTLQSSFPKYPNNASPVRAPVAVYRPRWTTSGFYNPPAGGSAKSQDGYKFAKDQKMN